MSNLNLCFGKQAEIIPSEDIEKNESCWGNEYAFISEEDINALRNGNVIYILVPGEYGVFIALSKGLGGVSMLVGGLFALNRFPSTDPY